jgi:hypothetical protein
MLRAKFLLLTCFTISFYQLKAQVIVKEHKFLYSYSDHSNCEFENLEITYPVFYYKNGKPLTNINDSVIKIVENEIFYLFEDNQKSFGFSDITGKTDTSIVIADTSASASDCDPISVIPMEGDVSYTVFINEDQLLSFAIRSSYHAGSGGHDAFADVAPLCYDLKTNSWVDLNTLFPDDFDTLLRTKADSLFEIENMNGIISEDDDFASVAVEKGNLTFYYTDHWGGKYFYREEIIPYEEFEKHLAPRYRKMLKNAPAKGKQ